MTGIVCVLCALTSLACAVLLLRGYFRTRARLLLWTGLCFAGLFINNMLLIVDSLHAQRQPFGVAVAPRRGGTGAADLRTGLGRGPMREPLPMPSRKASAARREVR